MEFGILLLTKKNALKIFFKNLFHQIVYLKKQEDLLNQLGLGQV